MFSRLKNAGKKRYLVEAVVTARNTTSCLRSSTSTRPSKTSRRRLSSQSSPSTTSTSRSPSFKPLLEKLATQGQLWPKFRAEVLLWRTGFRIWRFAFQTPRPSWARRTRWSTGHGRSFSRNGNRSFFVRNFN